MGSLRDSILRLKEYFKKRKRETKLLSNKHLNLSKKSVYDNSFEVKLENPLADKIYLSVGDNCVLSGRYIFERTSGKISIGNRVHIGDSMLICQNEIVIEDDVTIAWNCVIYDHDSHSVYWHERAMDTETEYASIIDGKSPLNNKNWDVVKSKPIKICSKAWIGMGVIILKGVTIGEGAVVGAGSVVTKNVDSWSVVAGNPARPVKYMGLD